MVDNVQLGSLSIEIEQKGEEVVYSFRGDVDESFKQEGVPRIEAPTIIFELSGIDTFNSVGIREWVYLLGEFSKLGRVVFRRCSVAMVDQINMVPDSMGNAVIESFAAPYVCETDDCQGEIDCTIDVGPSLDLLKAKKAPEFDCEKCGEPLEFDALEASYFAFLDKMSSAA